MPRTRTRRTGSAGPIISAPPAPRDTPPGCQRRDGHPSGHGGVEHDVADLYSREWELAHDCLAELLEASLERRRS